MAKKTIQRIAMDFVENKNEKTFSILLDRLKPGLNSFVYRFLEDRDNANDVVSKTFITVWEKIEQYNTKFNFSTWVYAIAKNECLHFIKESNKTISHEMLTENHSKLLKLYSPIDNINIELIDNKEDVFVSLYKETVKVINSLDEPYKTVMIERELNNKKLQDIAKDLDWNISTVKTRLRKAKLDVAKKIKKTNKKLIESYYDEIYS